MKKHGKNKKSANEPSSLFDKIRMGKTTIMQEIARLSNECENLTVPFDSPMMLKNRYGITIPNGMRKCGIKTFAGIVNICKHDEYKIKNQRYTKKHLTFFGVSGLLFRCGQGGLRFVADAFFL